MSMQEHNKQNQTFAGFFDFGFTRFITRPCISILWRLVVIAAFLAVLFGWGAALVTMMNGNPGGAIAYFFVIPIVTALYVLLIRIGYEFIIVVFRIESHLRDIRDHLEKK